MKKGKKKIVKFWLAELKDVRKEPELSAEHSEYRWLDKDDAIRKCKVPEFIEMINKFDCVAKTL